MDSIWCVFKTQWLLMAHLPFDITRVTALLSCPNFWPSPCPSRSSGLSFSIRFPVGFLLSTQAASSVSWLTPSSPGPTCQHTSGVPVKVLNPKISLYISMTPEVLIPPQPDSTRCFTDCGVQTFKLFLSHNRSNPDLSITFYIY